MSEDVKTYVKKTADTEQLVGHIDAAYKPKIPAAPLRDVFAVLQSMVGRSVRIKMYNNEERVVQIKTAEEVRTANGHQGATVISTPTGWINVRLVKEVLGLVDVQL